MKNIWLALCLSISVASGVAAAETPEWLTDLHIVERTLMPLAPIVTGDVSITVKQIRVIALGAKTKAALENALTLLPTTERRDRARKTLEPFTSWGLPVLDGPPDMAH